MYKKKGYYIYWNCKKGSPVPSKSILELVNLILVIEKYEPVFSKKLFPIRIPYFRLIHNLKSSPSHNLPIGFEFKDVNISTEIILVINLLSQCYPGSEFSEEYVLKWTDHPTFDQIGWFWVIESIKELPVALCITEFDSNIKEASIEWVQVLPEYRGKGIAKARVTESIKRYKSRAEFLTVSGETNNPTNPEILYR